MKKCSKCNKIKKYEEFYKHKNGTDGFHSECKECFKIRIFNYHRTKIGLITRIYNMQILSSKRKNFHMPKYSKIELINYLVNNNVFNNIFNNWEKSNYNKKLKPSIDRLNDYKGYSFDNIQITTWEYNNNKHYEDVKNGINNKINKSILQYDLNGNFIKEYYSISHAARENLLDVRNIYYACKKFKRTCGGYKWKLKNKK